MDERTKKYILGTGYLKSYEPKTGVAVWGNTYPSMTAVSQTAGPSRAQQNYASKSLDPFYAAMKNITPGMLQSPGKASAPKTATPAVKKAGGKSGPKKSTVARRLGVATPAAPVAAPVDPLETLRTEYSKYISDAYGGLGTALGANAEQYKTRSQEIADRLNAQYGDAANVAASADQNTQSELEAFAQRMGLQQATQGAATQDWMAQNERLKALNAAAKANSMSTNDIIRSNYYDFLVDRESTAKSSEAQAQAQLLDVVSQAKAQRLLQQQQAAAAAAAAASRARSSRGRGGSGSSSAKGGSTATITTSGANDVLAALTGPGGNSLARDIMMSQYAPSAIALEKAQKLDPYANMNPHVAPQPSAAAIAQADEARKVALALYYASGQGGNPVSSSKTTTTRKNVT